MQYKLQLKRTAAGVGYFAARPAGVSSFEEALAYLREHPYDEFMHKHALELLAGFDSERVRELFAAAGDRDPLLTALLVEATESFAELRVLREELTGLSLRELAGHTPLIDIRSMLMPDRARHRFWAELFGANMVCHQPLPHPSQGELQLLFAPEELGRAGAEGPSLREVRQEVATASGMDSGPQPSAEETAQRALERLQSLGMIASIEARHAASLSPHGLFRQWRLDLRVESGRHRYNLSGTQTSYGRGLSLAAARASCAMEMVERCSAFAGFDARGAVGYATAYPLLHATHGELVRQGLAALDPNLLALEIPYRDEKLYWLEARQQTGQGAMPIMVPAQCVFLFCNLDEVSLFSGLGSTGLASGNSLQEAKLSGLLEALERDAEAVTPFHVTQCFHLSAENPQVAGLLADYAAKGIHLQFQDLTTEFGIPCYKCFVIGADGAIHKGTGAHPDGRRALLSAMTETPYPYPYGPPSGPGLEGLPTVRFEDLSCYAGGDTAHDLQLLETLLCAKGHPPVYVDLTRSDLQIPVVKALIPGLELVADFDRFARVGRRLYGNYLRMFGGEG